MSFKMYSVINSPVSLLHNILLLRRFIRLVCIELKREGRKPLIQQYPAAFFFLFFCSKLYSFSRFSRFFARFRNTFVQTSHFFILYYSRMCTTYTVSSSHRVCQSSHPPIRCLSIDRNEPQPRLGVFLFFYLDSFHSVRLRNAPQWVFLFCAFFSIHIFAIRPSVLTSARNE